MVAFRLMPDKYARPSDCARVNRADPAFNSGDDE
jgi:hypothetical protein